MPCPRIRPPSGPSRHARAPAAAARPGALLGALLLAACAGSSGPKAEVDKAAVARYQGAGYAVRSEAGVVHQRLNSPMGLTPWTVTLSRAGARETLRPIIVYLPPLGAADDEPSRWVDLWAGAGYAVLTVQPLEDDAQIWTTDLARSGDFERVARARFTDEIMEDRLDRLARILGDLRNRGQAGEPVLAGLDWSHLAVAGSDLGAYTVQSLAQATPEQRAAMHWPLQPSAFLAVSPYTRANRNPPAVAHPPTLMISARDDIDAYGVVTDISTRHLAFDRLGAGDDYYFELGSATHRWLGGFVQAPTAGETSRALGPFSEPTPRERQRAEHKGAGEPSPADEELPPPEVQAKLAASRIEREALAAHARSAQLTHVALNEVSFADVSVSFFDAYLRQDARAQSWLRDAASGWLQDGDRLKHR